MAQLGGVRKCAIAVAEHDFVVAVVLAGDYQIGNSIAIKVRRCNVELCSSLRQLKRPCLLERAIAGVKENACGAFQRRVCGGIALQTRFGDLEHPFWSSGKQEYTAETPTLCADLSR